jgi:uncharacterized protein YndB with AHSA1/START domain
MVAGTNHGTVSVARTVDAPAERVYPAFVDARQREAWSAPSDTAVVIYDETDFRVRGRDVARCGARSDPRFRVHTEYINIVPNQRIVSTERIDEGDKLLAANLTTMEFSPAGNSTRVSVTVQVTSFVGEQMISNTEAGYGGSLANMARYLASRGGAPS